MLCDDLEGRDGVWEVQGEGDICVYISLTHFIVQQKLIQHGKEITLQFKKRMQILHSTLKKKNKKTKVAEE